MFLRKIGIVLAIILCGIILVFSYAAWKDKIETAGQNPEASAAPAAEKQPEEAAPVETEEKVSTIDMDALTASMDEEVKEVFSNRSEAGEKLQFLIAGSAAMESGDPGYAELLSEALTEAYGDFIEIEILAFDGTSEEFLNGNPKLSGGYDVVLLEPFTLMNNGLVQIEVEHEHIGEIYSQVLSDEEDAVLVLHPPQPIYGAQYYMTQVTALEQFASMRDFAYIDHWTGWPDTEDPAIEGYLTEDSNPNNEGAVIWADALIAYFTGN